MIVKASCTLIMAAALAAPAAAAEVVVGPQAIHLNPAGRGYFDMVVHNIGLRAGPAERWAVKSLKIELMANGQPVESRSIDGARLVAETANLLGAPVPQFVEAQLLSRDGLDGFFGAPTKPSRSAELEPGT